MQECEVPCAHVVEVDFDFGPVELCVVHLQTLRLVVDVGSVVDEARSVDAAPELPSEQVDPHDAEDEPEDQTHQQNVHDGRDRPDQSVDHHLETTRDTQNRHTHFTPQSTNTRRCQSSSDRDL